MAGILRLSGRLIPLVGTHPKTPARNPNVFKLFENVNFQVAVLAKFCFCSDLITSHGCSDLL